MKQYIQINVLASFAVLALLLVCSIGAQTEPVADQDLLKLLQTVSQEVATNTVEESDEVQIEEMADEMSIALTEPLPEASEDEAAPLEEAVVSVEDDGLSANDATEEVAEEVAEVATEEIAEVATEEVAEVVTEEVAEAVTDAVAVQEPIVDDLAMNEIASDAGSSVENLISVRLNKVGLEEAISLFAQLSGANIIVPDLAEESQISVNLKDVEWRPALQSILDTYDYELYQRVVGSNVYSVRRRPEGAPVAQVVETFVLKYATVPNAAALIRDLLPESAKVSEFASRNMIVVRSSETSLGEVRAVLETIDKVRQQVFIESKFMELSDGFQKDIGIDWKVLKSYQVSGRNLASSYSDSDSDSSVTDRSRLYDLNGDPLVDVSEPKYIDDGAGGFERYQTETPTSAITDNINNTITKLSTAVLNADDFSVVLSALEGNSGVNVVSNPKVIVANEEQANISIVTKEPNLRQSRQQSATDGTLDTVVLELDQDNPYFEYGIKLDVTPSINTSSNITVSIHPSLTREDPTLRKIVAPGVSYPTIEEKSIRTVFNLADGQTAAIGGLTEAKESEIERKVPLLGSIPVLGRLFSWEQTINDKRETIIFVTVGLANTQDIREDIGMPKDAEMARRRIILDRNDQRKRALQRSYFEEQESEKLEDLLQRMENNEQKRLEKRAITLNKEAKKQVAAAPDQAPKDAGDTLEDMLVRMEEQEQLSQAAHN